MLNENRGQFILHTEPLEAESRFLLHRVLLKDEEIYYTFSGIGCFGFFTNKRMIFINRPVEPANQTLTDECEFLPYHSVQRYGVVSEKKYGAANMEIYIPEFLPFRFYFPVKEDAFDFVKIIAEYCKI